MRWTRACRQTNGIVRGRRSRSVLIPRRWYQVGEDAFRIAPMTEARKPGLRGDYEGNRKTIAQGMPDYFGVPVVTTLVCSLRFACEAAGASSARHSLLPLLRRETTRHNLGAIGAAGARSRAGTTSDVRPGTFERPSPSRPIRRLEFEFQLSASGVSRPAEYFIACQGGPGRPRNQQEIGKKSAGKRKRQRRTS